MKVLITGANGQLGRALTGAIPAGVNVSAVTHSELDITSLASVRGKVDEIMPDVIVNAAAYTAVDRAESEPEQARLTNAVGPENLSKTAAIVGARLIHISTDFVFDGEASLPYKASSRTNPLNVYGRTKRDGENVVLKNLPNASVVLRTAWVYAADGRNFLQTMLKLMKEHRLVRVVADQIGSPTSANSVARAIWRAAMIPGFSGIHQWTDAGVASWYDFAVAIKEEAEIRALVPVSVKVVPIETIEFPTPARRPSYAVLDKRDTIEKLGIVPQHWRQELREVLEEIASA